MSAKRVAGTRCAIERFNGSGFKVLRANTPFASAQASRAAKSLRWSDSAIPTSRSPALSHRRHVDGRGDGRSVRRAHRCADDVRGPETGFEEGFPCPRLLEDLPTA